MASLADVKALLLGPLRRRRSGVTLIEAVLFIAIALGLIVSGLAFFHQASVAQQTQEMVRLVSAVSAEVRQNARWMPMRETDDVIFDNRTLIAMGAIPSDYVADAENSIIHSPWGEEIEITGMSQGAGGMWTPGSFAAAVNIRAYNVPAKVCARLAVFDSPSEVGSLGDGVAGIALKNVVSGDYYLYGSDAYYDWAAQGGFEENVITGGLSPADAGEVCRTIGPENYVDFGIWVQS